MDSFKVKVNFSNGRFAIKHVLASDESDACWKAKDIADNMKADSFDLMRSE